MHLCTNDEWQAATGTSSTSTTYPHGNNNCMKAIENSSETCQADPTTSGRCLTGTSPASWCSKYGVCDLNGNVWEWVNAIWYTSEPGNTSTVICWGANGESDVDKVNHICLKGWDVRGGDDGGYVSNWNYNYPIKGLVIQVLGMIIFQLGVVVMLVA